MAKRPLQRDPCELGASLAAVLTTSATQAQAPYPNQSIKFLVQAAPAWLPDTVAAHRRAAPCRISSAVGGGPRPAGREWRRRGGHA